MTKTTLTEQQAESVAQALVAEYEYLGVRLDVARERVATGEWDDHPAAGGTREKRDALMADMSARLECYRSSFPPSAYQRDCCLVTDPEGLASHFSEEVRQLASDLLRLFSQRYSASRWEMAKEKYRLLSAKIEAE